MTAIVDFYLNEGRCPRGRSFDDMMKYTDQEIEHTHDFIQWILPTKRPSAYNRSAPSLTDQDVIIIRNSTFGRSRLLRASDRFCQFLRLDAEGLPFWARSHNLLRITRMLESLTTLGEKERAREIFARALPPAKFGNVSVDTLEHWRAAVDLT